MQVLLPAKQNTCAGFGAILLFEPGLFTPHQPLQQEPGRNQDRDEKHDLPDIQEQAAFLFPAFLRP